MNAVTDCATACSADVVIDGQSYSESPVILAEKRHNWITKPFSAAENGMAGPQLLPSTKPAVDGLHGRGLQCLGLSTKQGPRPAVPFSAAEGGTAAWTTLEGGRPAAAW
jgi:hypothetical protein